MCAKLQFKVDAERKIFWETFHGNFIMSEATYSLKCTPNGIFFMRPFSWQFYVALIGFLSQIFWNIVSWRIFVFVLLGISVTWSLNHSLTSNMPTLFRIRKINCGNTVNIFYGLLDVKPWFRTQLRTKRNMQRNYFIGVCFSTVLCQTYRTCRTLNDLTLNNCLRFLKHFDKRV